MKIVLKEIEIFIYHPKKKNNSKFPLPYNLIKESIFLKIYTNNGIFGYGEPSPYNQDFLNACKIIKLIFNKYFKNKSLDDISLIKKELNNILNKQQIYFAALSGITQAIYDIESKISNKPLYQYLGTKKNKKKIPLYASGGMIFENQSYELLIDEAIMAKEMGFKGWKFRPKTPLKNPDHFLRNLNPPEFNHKEILDFSIKLKKIIGENFLLMIDFGKRIKTISQAIKIIDILEDLNFYFIEEPMILLKKNYLKIYKNHRKLKIAIGEHLINFKKAKKILNYKTDILQPDSNLMPIDEIMKLFNKSKKTEYILHNWSFPISMLSNFHLAGASEYVNLVEYSLIGENEKNRLITKKLDIRNGYFYHNSNYGIGYKLNEKYLYKLKFND